MSSVHDFCRFCHKNLRRNGIVCHSVKIFENTGKNKTVCDRLVELGLTMSRHYKISIRSCRKCVYLLSRVEQDLPIFRRWEEQEKDLSTAASSAGRSDTEEPRPPQKKSVGTQLSRKTMQYLSRCKATQVTVPTRDCGVSTVTFPLNSPLLLLQPTTVQRPSKRPRLSIKEEEEEEEEPSEGSSSTKMHITIQRGRSLPGLQRCTLCCDLYHCPFCHPSLFQPTKQSKVKNHLEGHFNRAVSHEGYTIHRCGLHCKPQLHFHCIHCQAILIRRPDFIRHLALCKEKHPAHHHITPSNAAAPPTATPAAAAPPTAAPPATAPPTAAPPATAPS